MESIIAFCQKHPDLGASYNQDLDDCRRVVSVSCTANKKGMEAKKELVGRLFGEAKEDSDEIDGTCANCEYGIDYGESVLYIKYSESGKEKDVKKNDSCHNYTPVEDDTDWEPKGDLEGQLAEHLDAVDKKENVCPYYISHKEDEPFIQCRDMVNTRHADWIRPRENGELHNRYFHYTCKGSYYACALYAEMKSKDENKSCSIGQCPFHECMSDACAIENVRQTGPHIILEHAEKVKEYCPVKYMVDRHKREIEEPKEDKTVIPQEQKCEFKDDECPYYCNHNEGCSLKLSTGDAIKLMLKSMGEYNCDVYMEAISELKVITELVKPEDRYIEEEKPQTFDYSTVDTETAAFLQEKEAKITQIRMMSVLAIGKELKEVHEKLANHYQGTFGKWCKNIGITDQTAMNYIKAHEYVAKNFGNIEDAESIQPSLLFAISKTSAPAELQIAVMDGDITTHKQYKELEAQLKAREAEKEAEEKKARENYLAAQRYKEDAEAAKRALQQSQSEHQRKNDNHKFEIDNLNRTIQELRSQINDSSEPVEVEELRMQLKEAQRQVNILTDELMKPVDVEPAIVEKEVEVERAADKDFEYISDIIGKLLTAHTGQIKNWAKVLGENSKFDLESTRQNLIAMNRQVGNMMDAIEDQISNKH
jgi:hypothetical protein